MKSKNDVAWERLFEQYKILDQIEQQGIYRISANQIKAIREPRLMAKFDHSINLPEIFRQNQLSILPISRSEYILSKVIAYQNFDVNSNPIQKVNFPENIQSLNPQDIYSEGIAINCALASGILEDFLDEKELTPTVFGRMSSGDFSFSISSTDSKSDIKINVSNSQIEIDCSLESVESLSILEAKIDISDDFIIRQLYYPFRRWNQTITKDIRSIFLVFSNGIYTLYEYRFTKDDSYNSISLVNQKSYSIDDTTIQQNDLDKIISNISFVLEPEVPFPQADKFERVINLCELLIEQELSTEEISTRYDFDLRQADYYTNAGIYLGLIEKKKDQQGINRYSLSLVGRRIITKKYKERQLDYSKLILEHKVFFRVLQKSFSDGIIPSQEQVVDIMKECDLYGVRSEDTFKRRSATIRSWIGWIINLKQI